MRALPARFGTVACAPALVLVALLFVACGGDGEDIPPFPTLVGTPIPTVRIEPSPTPACDVDAPAQLPANFPPPAEILLPPDLVLSSAETTPHMRIVGRTVPPIAEGSDEQPAAVLSANLVLALRDRGWTGTFNPEGDGYDYDLTHPDGRTAHFNAQRVPGCPDVAQLTLDLYWITG